MSSYATTAVVRPDAPPGRGRRERVGIRQRVAAEPGPVRSGQLGVEVDVARAGDVGGLVVADRIDDAEAAADVEHDRRRGAVEQLAATPSR